MHQNSGKDPFEFSFVKQKLIIKMLETKHAVHIANLCLPDNVTSTRYLSVLNKKNPQLYFSVNIFIYCKHSMTETLKLWPISKHPESSTWIILLVSN